MENIVVGSSTFTPYSEPTGSRDPAIWRSEDTAVPAMFRSTMMHTAQLNATKTNVNETLVVEVPIVTTDAATGQFVSKNKYIASAKFTALQNVVGDDYAVLALDGLIELLTARRSAILAGKTK